MKLANDEISFKASSDVERIPPQNIEAEEAVLGGILLDPEAIVRVKSQLQPRHFYILAHRTIYEAMCKLADESMPTDLLQVISKLKDNDLLDKVGGRNKLASLVDRTVSAVNIDKLAELVMEKFARRELIKLGRAAIEMGYASQDEKSIQDCSSTIIERMLAIQDNQVKDSETVHISDALHNVYLEVEERSENTAIPGSPTGYYDVDALLLGMKPAELIIVAGRPSMGKTALAMNVAHNLGKLYNKATVVFSLEMSNEQIAHRLLSSESEIESSYLQTGRLSNSQWEPLSKATADLSNLPIYLNDFSVPNIAHFEAETLKVQMQAQRSGSELGLVIIDYLQLLEGEGGANRNYEISKITRGLKLFAKRIKCPVMVLSQLSRNVETRTNKRPMLADLRDSGSIEQDADRVLMLYRDDYYNSDSFDKDIAEVIVTKNRTGSTGTVKLLFDPHYCKFKNLVN